MSVSGIILAAGQSSRLGRSKQLLPLAGRPLLAHVIAHAAASDLDETILVLGHEATAIAAALGDLGQRTMINPEYAAGQSTSVRAGLSAVSPESDAVMFLLGDQPTVTSEIINALLTAYRTKRAPILVPTYGGQRGNPVLFDRALFPELHRVTGDEGARAIVRANAHGIRLVTMPGDRPPPDVDTEEDYQQLLASWTGEGSGFAAKLGD
ncbi:MAG: molybdenum cofactor cytidylyltransferase [Chloroflexia bacterium]|nr:molybdenum cofactor cytidylyltransferase [Chloroflexia bacterium]